MSVSTRDYFAAKALVGHLSNSCGKEGHVPAFQDSDFERCEWEKGKTVFYKSAYWYHSEQSPTANYERQPHRLLTTYPQRLARDCYALADAMLAERGAAS